jgi:hypothetical protein
MHDCDVLRDTQEMQPTLDSVELDILIVIGVYRIQKA